MKKWTFLILIIVCFVYCTKQDKTSKENLTYQDSIILTSYPKDSFQVSLQEAMKVATEIYPDPITSTIFTWGTGMYSETKDSLESRYVSNIIIPFVINDRVLMYIVNVSQAYNLYNKWEGTIILSGDKRYQPILAYIDRGKFPNLTSEKLPSGFLYWFENMIDDIRSLNNHSDTLRHNLEIQKQNIQIWHKLLTFDKKEKDKKCFVKVEEIKPLVTTEWGQENGYNAYCPFPKPPYESNTKMPTGVVVTTLAQVLQYYQFPWKTNIEKDIPYAASIMASLSKKIHMDTMSPHLTGFSYNRKIEDLTNNLIKDFQYTTAKCQDGDYKIMKNELRNKRLVILEAIDDSACLCHISSYMRGWDEWADHYYGEILGLWLCDGFRSVKSNCSQQEYNFFHMNWGAEGNYNGWYAMPSNPKHMIRKMTVNIQPNTSIWLLTNP